MKKKKVYVSVGLGCIIVVFLCVIGVFWRPRWSYISTSLSEAREKKSYRELQAQQLSNLGNIIGVYFRPDGERILTRGEWRYDEATTQEFSDYRLYDKQGNLIADLGEAEWGYITSDGIVLVPMSESKPVENLGISIASWKLSFWSWDGKLIKDEAGCCGAFPKLIFNLDSSKFATFRGYRGLGYGAKEEYLWSSDGQKIATLFSPNGEGIDGVSFSPTGKLIATPAYTATWLWDENGNLLHTLSLPDDKHAKAEVYFSPDGTQLAVSDKFNHSEIWTTEGQLITILKDIEVLTYSPDSRYLVVRKFVNGYDDQILLFDVQKNFTPKPLIIYDRLYDLRFSTDGQYFITFGCTDGQEWESGFFCYGGKATLWDKDGNLISALKGLAEVTQAGFVANSDKIFIAGCDAIVEYSRVIPSYDCVSHSLRLHDYSGSTIAILSDEIGDFWISPDGKSFITTTQRYGGKAKLWKFPP